MKCCNGQQFCRAGRRECPCGSHDVVEIIRSCVRAAACGEKERADNDWLPFVLGIALEDAFAVHRVLRLRFAQLFACGMGWPAQVLVTALSGQLAGA